MKRFHKWSFVFFLVTCSLMISFSAALAEWIANGAEVCTAAGHQAAPTVVTDGSGGAIITWQDQRSGNWDIYAQHIDAIGKVQWRTNGEAVCVEASDQVYPVIVSDGSGGAIIAWQDQRNGNWNIYAQRVDESGSARWAANGVALCADAWHQRDPAVLSDGCGGAIIAWQDDRSEHSDIYAQRVDGSGNVRWALNGAPICRADWSQGKPAITSDDSGGAIITWHDERKGPWSIYAQRVDADGNVQWGGYGKIICAAIRDQQHPSIVSDRSGGAIITWHDYRSGSANIYAQRVDADGYVQWMWNGVAICRAANTQLYPIIIPDGSGGAIITWLDYRSGFSDIYAQCVDAGGFVRWMTDGAAICTAAGHQGRPTIASDGSGGAIITWHDFRNGLSDICAQHVDANGHGRWYANGAAICAAASNQLLPASISDGSGGAIIAWNDYRGTDLDIYTQRLYAGAEGFTPSGAHVVVRPVDSATGTAPVTIAFDSVTVVGLTSLTISSKGEPPPCGFRICSNTYYELTTTAAYVDSIEICIDYSASGCKRKKKLKLARFENGDWVDYTSSHDADSSIICGMVSSLSTFAVFIPMEIAFDIKPLSCPNPFNMKWLDNGHRWRGDNHAPHNKGGVLPAALVGNADFDVIDIDVFTLRLEGIAPLRTGFEDVTRPATGTGECPCTAEGPDGILDLTLKFSRQEVAGILGEVEHGDVVELTITGALSDGTQFEATDCVTILSTHPKKKVSGGGDDVKLYPAMPNPFNPTTEIRYDVPAAGGNVTLKIYDVSGRLVRVLVDARESAGEKRVGWDGKDGRGRSVASGVYFYCLEASGFMQTRKMVLLR